MHRPPFTDAAAATGMLPESSSPQHSAGRPVLQTPEPNWSRTSRPPKAQESTVPVVSIGQDDGDVPITSPSSLVLAPATKSRTEADVTYATRTGVELPSPHLPVSRTHPGSWVPSVTTAPTIFTYPILEPPPSTLQPSEIKATATGSGLSATPRSSSESVPLDMNGASHPSNHTGMIVGVSVGCFGFAIVSLIALFILLQRKKKKERKTQWGAKEDALVWDDKSDTQKADGRKSVFTLAGLPALPSSATASPAVRSNSVMRKDCC
ncbi:hypothetical protein CC80DRAFT_179980 [Byssothecium circinans]|uniref:Mid2 domain-containing protein n=1 Tax=Byssothecium circinans TaxID=147558 RepID=A0A6A5TL30_9PLEO|nr:hypothetical protein CC80DRAFT_179980 [Byssothecium circinans]